MTKKKVLSFLVAVAVAGLVLAAQQLGLITPDPDVSSRDARPSTPNRSPVIEREAPATRPTATATASAPGTDTGVIRRLFEQKKSDAIVTVDLEVVHVLPDDNEGSRHQRFLADTADGVTVKVAHNIDLAERVPLREGDTVTIRGEYEWNDKGGVLHWTHHDPKGWHEDGYIELDGVRYE